MAGLMDNLYIPAYETEVVESTFYVQKRTLESMRNHFFCHFQNRWKLRRVCEGSSHLTHRTGHSHAFKSSMSLISLFRFYQNVWDTPVLRYVVKR